MFLAISFSLFAVLTFLFIFWKRLKEDYLQNQIFTSGFCILLGIAIANIISDNFLPKWWFWLSLVGISLGTIAGIYKYNFRIFETVEAVILSSLFLYFWFFVYNWLSFLDSKYLGASAVVFGTIMLFLVFDKRYKHFTWYRSGRVGFSGMATAGVFFITRSLVALIMSDMVSFVGKIDAIISALLAFTAFLILFNLSQTQT